MPEDEQERGATESPPRCSRCGDVVGVYEPAVLVRDGRALRTSRAARDFDLGADTEIYHRDCYAEIRGEPPAR